MLPDTAAWTLRFALLRLPAHPRFAHQGGGGAHVRMKFYAIKGMAAEQTDLENLMKSIGTIKILKYDTKTAISSAPDVKKYSFIHLRAFFHCDLLHL